MAAAAWCHACDGLVIMSPDPQDHDCPVPLRAEIARLNARIAELETKTSATIEGLRQALSEPLDGLYSEAEQRGADEMRQYILSLL